MIERATLHECPFALLLEIVVKALGTLVKAILIRHREKRCLANLAIAPGEKELVYRACSWAFAWHG